MGDWKDIIAYESEGVKPVAGKYTWLWIALIVVGILGFSTVLVMKRKQNSQVKENK